MAGAWRFSILGHIEVTHRGRVVPLGEAPTRAVLAMLLLDAGSSVSFERLDLGVRPAAQAGGGSRRWTRSGRRHFGVASEVAALDRALGPDRLVIDETGVSIRVEVDEFDLWRCESDLADAASARRRGDMASATASYGAALARWRGPALGDLRHLDFASDAVAALDECQDWTYEMWLDGRLAIDDRVGLVAELERAVNDRPSRPRRWTLLVSALVRDGRLGEAQQVCAAGCAELDGLAGPDWEAELHAALDGGGADRCTPEMAAREASDVVDSFESGAWPDDDARPVAVRPDARPVAVRPDARPVAVRPDARPVAVRPDARRAPVRADMPGPHLVLPDGRRLRIVPGRSTLGRSSACDLVVGFDGVSRCHALVDWDGTSLSITDRGSTNGVTVNGRRVAVERLSHGDSVRLGRVDLTVEVVDAVVDVSGVEDSVVDGEATEVPGSGQLALEPVTASKSAVVAGAPSALPF